LIMTRADRSREQKYASANNHTKHRQRPWPTLPSPVSQQPANQPTNQATAKK
jgi:hypothetical protein